jgi:hypothetical protein
MMLFPIWIEHPFDMSVQRPHDADARHHRRAAARSAGAPVRTQKLLAVFRHGHDHPKPGNGFALDKTAIDLLNRGWPSGALLLSEVVTNWGKHHLVLVVRTRSGDLVLDNLTPQIKPWADAPYRWVRIQIPNRPLWTTLAGRGE